MKNPPKWAVLAVLAAVAYLVYKSSGELRRDAWRASQDLSARTGGALPAAPRSWLGPVTPGDPQFGVRVPQAPTPPVSVNPWQEYADYWGFSLGTQYDPSGVYVGTQPVASTPTFGVRVN